MLLVVDFKVLDYSDCSGDAKTANHGESDVASLIKSLSFDLRIKIHTLCVSGFAGKDWTDDIDTFDEV